MSRIRPISRFGQWRLWWTHTAWFQWAHAPLCRRFDQDLLRIGRCRVCRSCTLLYGAGALAAMAVILSGMKLAPLHMLFGALLVPATVMSCPLIYRRFSRRIRDGVRAAMGAALGMWPVLLLTGGHPAALGALPVLVVIYRCYGRQRSELKSHMCDGCAELNEDHICSGYAQQADSIRLFQIRIEESLNRCDKPPAVVLAACRERAEVARLWPGKPNSAEIG